MFLVELDDGTIESLDARTVQSRKNRIRAFLLDPDGCSDGDRADPADPMDLTISTPELSGVEILS